MIEDRPQLPVAPEAGLFAAAPAFWYLLGRSREIGLRPRAVSVAGRRAVAFRTAGGQLAVLAARCAHLGADLTRGEVTGETLRCPFHGWEYAADGACVRIPTTCAIPAFARQERFAATERWGLVFAWSGARPELPLPLPERDGELVAARPLAFAAPFPWYMVCGNAFDVQHLRSVHGRELLAEPEIDDLPGCARRIRYRTRIRAASPADRLLRLLAGEEVEVSIAVFGGTLLWVEARFPRAVSRILFGVEPAAEGGSRVVAVPLAPRPRLAGRLALPLLLALRRLLTRAFVEADLTTLDGVRYDPETLIPSDRPLAEFLAWAAALPAADAPSPARNPVLRRISP